jgi:hypothetical protein
VISPKPINLNRDEIAAFAKAPKTIRAIEDLNLNQDELVSNIADIRASPVIGVTLSPIYTDDRALTGSADIALSDGGPKSNLSIALTPSGVSAATYGSASQTVAFAVDAKGRITLAAQYALITTNITEGANLYFTTARARLSIYGSSTVTYDSTTGVISLTNGNIVTGLGFTPQVEDPYLNAISGTVPAPDGTYLNPTSITIVNGIVVAIS